MLRDRQYLRPCVGANVEAADATAYYLALGLFVP